jgi:hypothetical protein
MNTSKPFTYEADPEYDYVLEERANTFAAARKIKWGSSENFKLDIRKYRAQEDGEHMLKGVSLSDEGADELTRVLLKTGYGNSDDIAGTILESRKDIAYKIYDRCKNMSEEELEEFKNSVTDEDDDIEQYYDLNEVV